MGKIARKRLKANLEYYKKQNETLHAAVATYHSRRDKIASLHHAAGPWNGIVRCVECRQIYPCPTVFIACEVEDILQMKKP